VLQNFQKSNLMQHIKRFPGDQDYISSVITQQQRRYIDSERVKSWRWQCLDGGYDFKKKQWKTPGSGTVIGNSAILIFHGSPKPHDIQDSVIAQYWG
jgi:hypothetical protein